MYVDLIPLFVQYAIQWCFLLIILFFFQMESSEKDKFRLRYAKRRPNKVKIKVEISKMPYVQKQCLLLRQVEVGSENKTAVLACATPRNSKSELCVIKIILTESFEKVTVS